MTQDDPTFWWVLKNRTSVRSFTSDPVPKEMVDKLLEAARLAPVAGGHRNVTVQVFDDPAYIAFVAEGVGRACTEAIISSTSAHPNLKNDTLAYAKNFSWFGKAPILLAVSCRKTPPYMREYVSPIADDLFGGRASASMSIENILLAVTALGLGACCLTGPLFARNWLEKELKTPPQNVLVALVPLGFPAKAEKDSSDLGNAKAGRPPF